MISGVEVAHYAWVLLLIFGAAIAWTTNFVALPGNWFIVGLAALFAWALPESAGELGWQAVGVLAGLALLGEVLEFVAGAAGAANQGASRRAVALALVGTVAGSIAGAVIGLPIPVIGPLLGALAGGAAGAYAGAYLGETWKGRDHATRASVSRGALIGRLLGTAGKLVVGIVMVATIAVRGFS